MFQGTALPKSKIKALDDKLVDALVSCNLPFSLLDDQDFRAFVAELNDKYELPKRTKASELVAKAYQNAEKRVDVLLR